MTYFGSVVVLPLWLQTVMGYTSSQAGMALAPSGIFSLILAPILGRNITKINLRAFSSVGFLILGLVSLWNSFMTLDIDFWGIVNPRIIQGIGMSFFYLPIQSLMMSNVPADRMAAASGLSNFLRTLGAAMGTAISVTMWEDMSSAYRAQLASNVSRYSNASNEYIATLQSSGMSADQALGAVERMVSSQSIMLATNQFFLYSAAAFFAMSWIVWLTNPKKITAAPVGH
jgi:DHA2 family multidrug resistance protein